MYDHDVHESVAVMLDGDVCHDTEMEYIDRYGNVGWMEL